MLLPGRRPLGAPPALNETEHDIMKRFALGYGGITGLVIIGTTIVGFFLVDPEAIAGLEWLGYLVMFAAFALVFVGVKRYRDEELGGVIRFGTALRVGLAMTLVASAIYVAAWETTQYLTDYRFMNDYAASYIAQVEASGASAAEIEAERAKVTTMVERMGNPAFRTLITFSEIFPVGLLVTLFSAAVLRRPDALPA
jgi:hypothetical protein